MITDDDLEDLFIREGPESDHPNDTGGRTKWGISETANPDLWADGEVTKDEAILRYRAHYITRNGIEKLPEPLDKNVFDFGVTSGPSRAVKTLQFLLGVEQDGRIGPRTLDALASKDVRLLNNLYCSARETFYRSIVHNDPSQKVFLKGWLNRAKTFYAPASAG